MTTKEAFAQLICKWAWYKELGITEPVASALASRFRTGEKFSIEKVEQVLKKAGYQVVQEKQWEVQNG